jgi:hypothetical protein
MAVIPVWGATLYHLDDLPYKDLQTDFPKTSESFRAKAKSKIPLRKDLEIPD